jgi:hypothetical protein
MFERIKNQVQDINNRVNFGMTYSYSNKTPHYFIEITDNKHFVERTYLNIKEYNILFDLNVQKTKILNKIKNKKGITKCM